MVASWISSGVTPRVRDSYTANSRSSSWARTLACSSSSVSSFMCGLLRLSREISAPRTAFMMASSKVWPMAITSPVAFIWVPRVRLA